MEGGDASANSHKLIDSLHDYISSAVAGLQDHQRCLHSALSHTFERGLNI